MAREAYERVLAENPNHAKVLQQLGWLYHQQNSNFSNQELAISYLLRSSEAGTFIIIYYYYYYIYFYSFLTKSKTETNYPSMHIHCKNADE